MKLKIGNQTYSPLYKFDGGEYFTEDNATSGEAWVALLDDGSLQLLVNGVHVPYDAEYEMIEEIDEMALTRELGELQREYSLTDKSEENIKRGERIKEIREELGLVCKPRADRKPPRVVNR